MDSSPTKPLLHIFVNNANKILDPLSSNGRIMWHPLDRLEGHILVQSQTALKLEKVDIRFEGNSRVWVKAIGQDNDILTVKSSYNFLVQSQEATHIGHITDTPFDNSTYTTPFSFVIPRWALAKCTVPDQCLTLPPSMSLGLTRTGEHEHDRYAEPKISYHIRVMVRYRIGELPEAQNLEAWKEILFMPITEIQPPTNIRDFPAEFIESQTQHFHRSLFGGPTFIMTLAMIEPSAVKVKDMRVSGSTLTELSINVQPAEGKAYAENSDQQLSQSLQNLTFNIESILRLKTFYSLSPFSRVPGQTMLTTRGTVRFRDEVVKLQSPLHAKPFESTQRRLSNQPPSYLEVDGTALSVHFDKSDAQSASTDLQRSWSTLIRVPIQIPAGLLPTFCSAVVARYYSIITRIRFSNAYIKPMMLEVPVQIIYSPQRTVDMTAAVDNDVPASASDNEKLFIANKSGVFYSIGVDPAYVADLPRNSKSTSYTQDYARYR